MTTTAPGEKTLYQINIALRGREQPLGVQMREKRAAEELVQKITSVGDSVTFEDDYGHQVTLSPSSVLYVVISDLKRDFQVQEEVNIMKNIAQIKLEKRMKTDPIIKFLMSGQAISPLAH